MRTVRQERGEGAALRRRDLGYDDTRAGGKPRATAMSKTYTSVPTWVYANLHMNYKYQVGQIRR